MEFAQYARFDPTAVKLGKLPYRHDDRTLHMAKYLNFDVLPPAKPYCDYARKVSEPCGMMLNNNLGCCTISAAGHAIQAWTANSSSTEMTLPDAAILKGYEACGGYVDGDPSTDNGCVILDVLKYWRNTGFGGGTFSPGGVHKIAAFMKIEQGNLEHLKIAIELFGLAYIGVMLPITAQSQGYNWYVQSTTGDGAPGSWGGHCVGLPKYNTTGLFQFTWGLLGHMSNNFLSEYCDEAWAIVTHDWINAQSGKAPSGFDFATLMKDVAYLN